ncbi:hypothetical protein FK004_05045 [Flavobacterium kingsejongi]|uniref:Uncharacterized protein n=1 Tax=Flavobacterium kingsejongi TaxID=1678728 RepID=A0A2S1LLM6_9FLAO|nr:hypothetical protein FK004_05045 [Flavobacterium kingsejongi]
MKLTFACGLKLFAKIVKTLVKFAIISQLAPMVAASFSFCFQKKRYSGQRDRSFYKNRLACSLIFVLFLRNKA